MGRQAEKGMSWPSAGSRICLMMFCLVAWKRVPLTARPMTVAERRHERPQQKLQFSTTSSCLFTRSFPRCNQRNFQLRSSSFYLSKKIPPYLRELPVTGGVFCGQGGNLIFGGGVCSAGHPARPAE